MNHIPTTATAVQKMRRLAKDRRKTSRESLAAAQDAVAKEHGYAHWKHVTVCAAETTAAKAAPVALSESIVKFLEEQQASQVKIAATQVAIRQGLVFAMDIKDAMSVAPESRPNIHECEDARAFLAGDIWASVLRREREEALNSNTSNDEDSLREFLDYTGNYSFFRYSGDSVPSSVDAAFGTVFRGFFFLPSHVWIGGNFIDIADLDQVRSGVDGPVMMSASSARNGAPSVRTYAPATDEESEQPAAAPARPGERRPLVVRLDVRRVESALYEYRASYSGQELFYSAGFTSIAATLKAAADVTGDIVGFEVAYAGLVVGTYGVHELQADAEAVAQRAVETAAALRYS